MKQQNHQRLELAPIQYQPSGLEVIELFGSFAEAQWLDVVSRYYDDLVRPWQETEKEQ